LAFGQQQPTTSKSQVANAFQKMLHHFIRFEREKLGKELACVWRHNFRRGDCCKPLKSIMCKTTHFQIIIYPSIHLSSPITHDLSFQQVMENGVDVSPV
jgi:hypothetical protein